MRSCLGVLIGLGCVGPAACGTSYSEPPDFPESYAVTYTEVRNCRFSIEHNQLHVRVLVSPEALAPYRDRVGAFPSGSVVLKEEYSASDKTCSGGVVDYTVMSRLPSGMDPGTLDWAWQRVSPKREVAPDDISSCVQCHANCASQGVGYMGTCEEP